MFADTLLDNLLIIQNQDLKALESSKLHVIQLEVVDENSIAKAAKNVSGIDSWIPLPILLEQNAVITIVLKYENNVKIDCRLPR